MSRYESIGLRTSKGRTMKVPPRPDSDHIDTCLEDEWCYYGNQIKGRSLDPINESMSMVTDPKHSN
jgi:hypothetical protein